MSNPRDCAVKLSAIGESFDDVVVPHLDAAYRLALWLVRNKEDAEDAVQEASLRAFRYFRTFAGGNGRAWFLRIVRNTCYGRRGGLARASADPFDEAQHSSAQPASDPETLLLQTDDVRLIERAMRHLPHRFRELLVLRELEGLSYRELAAVMGMPMGTVMSSLSRARQAFRGAWTTSCSGPAFDRGHIVEQTEGTRLHGGSLGFPQRRRRNSTVKGKLQQTARKAAVPVLVLGLLDETGSQLPGAANQAFGSLPRAS